MAGKPSLRADCERQRKLIDHISLIEIPAIPSLKKFAVFRVRGMPVEERRKPIRGGLGGGSLPPTSSPSTPRALFYPQIVNCCRNTVNLILFEQ